MKKEREIPIIVYFSFVIAFALTWVLWFVYRDLAINLVAELLGALLILFVIDNLIRRDKRKRWLIVKDETEYLLARTVNRLRQNVLENIFLYSPTIKAKSRDEFEVLVREDREKKLRELSRLNDKELLKIVNKDLLSAKFNDYFEERSEELWKYLNMRYSEYFSPAVVQNVIELHVMLNDLCSHTRIYKKSRIVKSSSKYLESSGEEGVIYCIRNIIRLLIELKEMGYSETAKKR